MSVASPTLCENDTAPWGSICESCGQRLPRKPGPLTSWKAQRNIDTAHSERATAALTAQSEVAELFREKVA